MKREEKKLLKIGVKIWVEIPLFFIRKLGGANKDFFIQQFFLESCRGCEKYSSFFTSFLFRPKKAKQVPYNVALQYNAKDIAIVMQGPLVIENDFTLETVKFYNKYFDGLKIIISTWKGADSEYIHKIEEQGAIVLRNEIPEYTGFLNLNLQIFSSFEGIKKAKELGCKYICKVRCDQRLYSKDSLVMMKTMINMYPIKKSKKSKQKQRIICIGGARSGMFIPFFHTDFLYFGVVDDIVRLFDIPFDNLKRDDSLISRRMAFKTMFSPEHYISINFVRNCEVEVDDTIESYWEYLKSNLIIVDRKLVGFYWYKRDKRFVEHSQDGTYHLQDSEDSLSTCNFEYSTWLNLYAGELQYPKEMEYLNDLQLHSS